MKFTNQCVLVFASLLSNTSVFSASPLDFYYQKYRESKTPVTFKKSVHADYFKQLVSHKKQGKKTFKQRYFIDETFGPNADAPVFFYICGESACSPFALDGAMRRHAKKYRAKLVALEHRYYGQSIPSKTLSTNDMKLLNTDEAVEDLAYFQSQLVQEKNWTGKWVAFGGGYSGSLAAYYRSRFPHLIAGALASSAPVKASADFIEFDSEVTRIAGTECANNIRSVVHDIESSLTNKVDLMKMKTLFGASAVKNSTDFLALVADIAAASIQYGQKDAFCTLLSSSSTPLEGYTTFARNLYKQLGVTPVKLTPEGALSENPGDYSQGLGLRQWYYQACTEYGDWQNANPNPFLSTRSILIDAPYHQKICKRLFGITKPVDTSTINDNFYSPLLSSMTSRIYFTNGQNDPFASLSLTASSSNKRLTYYTIKNGGHAEDLLERTAYDSKSLKFARTKMELMIQDWLVGCSLKNSKAC